MFSQSRLLASFLDLGCVVALAWLVTMSAGCDRPSFQRDAVIVGDSMVPSFQGQHWLAKCPGCDTKFEVSASKTPTQFVCRNCGRRDVDANNAKLISAADAQVRLISKDDLKRWDVVAVAGGPDQPVVVKRVAGMPGETLSFVDGDLFANGKLLRKPANINRQIRVRVFDSQNSAGALVERLRSESRLSDWHADRSFPPLQYLPQQISRHASEKDWLVWHQWRCVDHAGAVDQDFPIEDYYGENQSVARNLNALDDIWVALDVKLSARSVFTIRWTRGSIHYDFCFSPADREVQFECSDDSVKNETFSANIAQGATNHRLELVTFDRQLAFLIDDALIAHVLLGTERLGDVATWPVKLAAAGGKAEIRRFQLWRDLYYSDSVLDRPGSGMSPLSAGPNGVLLLGDNVPVSIDSRHWPDPGVPVDAILGVVQAKNPDPTR